MWIKDDDRMIHHPKFRRAAARLGGPHAFARVLCCFKAGQCYANHHETGGRLEDAVVAGFVQFVDDPAAIAAALVACKVRDDGAGLWERVEGGYQIHDYEQYQPPPDRRAAISEVRARAGRKGGQRSGASRRAASIAESREQQVAAANAVNLAIKRGDLVRGVYEKCGDPDTQGHHDDYTKPLVVRWLCQKHHDQWHVAQRKQVASSVGSTNEASDQTTEEPKRTAETNPVPDPDPRASQNEALGGRAPARETHPRRASLVSGPDPRIRRYGRVNVWQWQHDALRTRLGVGDLVALDRQLDEFYTATEARWDATGEIPEGREVAVWQREFDRAFATPAARAVPSTRWQPGPVEAASTRWEALCDALEARGAVNRHNRLAWLRPCVQVRDTADELVVHVTEAAQLWIAKHYQPALEQTLAEIAPGCALALVVDQEAIA